MPENSWLGQCRWVLLSAIFLAALDAQASPRGQPSFTFRGCLTDFPATRTGTESCWVRMNHKEGQFCLPRSLWINWLRNPTSLALCGQWEGKAGVVSFLQNEGEEKKTLARYRVTRWQPDPLRELGFWGRGVRTLERTREWASVALRPYDRLGIMRQLLLNERVPGSPGGVLRTFGFVHLLSATGIHLYALASTIDYGLQVLARFTALSVRAGLAVSRTMAFVLWLVAWLLAGGRPGMLRPWLVVCARSGARYFGFRWQRFASLGIALLADLAVASVRSALGFPDPWAPGRWIYALAVGGGLMALAGGTGRPSFVTHLRAHLLLSVGSWILVALVEAWADGLVAGATPLLSLLTLPLFCSIFYPCLLLGILLHLSGAEALGINAVQACASLATFSVECFGWISLRVPSLWWVSRPAIIAGAVLAMLWFLVKRRRAKVLALLCIFGARSLIDFFPVTNATKTKSWNRPVSRIEQLDVGQGDAALIGTPESGVGLIDAGAEQAFDEARWLKLLARRGITRLDWVLMTHLDADHIGGLVRLARIVPIGCLAASRALLETPKGREISKNAALRGLRLTSLGAACVPYPTRETGKAEGRNEGMAAILIPLAGGGFYFSAGDAGGENEEKLATWAARHGANLKPGPRLLKASHHGSRFSSSREVLAILRPTEAWLSSGVGNFYGHPAPDALRRLVLSGARIRRTDREGAILWVSRAGDTGLSMPKAAPKIFRRADIPAALEPIYFDFHWAQQKLWSLPLKSESLKISLLDWVLDYPIWASAPPEKIYDLSPREVLVNLDRFPKHALRIHQADTRFPLHVMEWRGRCLVMDGFHRLLKAMLAGENEVTVYKVPLAAIPLIQPDSDQESGFLKFELARRDEKLGEASSTA